MESIIYNKIFGTMFVDIMLENHAWHRYWDGFHVSHNEPAITWCNVLPFLDTFRTQIFSHCIFWHQSRSATFHMKNSLSFTNITNNLKLLKSLLNVLSLKQLGYKIHQSLISIKISLCFAQRQVTHLFSKLSEVFEVTFFRISSKPYVGTGYIFLV